MTPRWTFGQAWAAFRDVASWGLGAFWGNEQMTSAAPGDPAKIALIAALLAVPFAARADELRLRLTNRHQQVQNGSSPASDREPTAP